MRGSIGNSYIALLCFIAFMFSLFLLLLLFIDVHLSHLNKNYLLTYLPEICVSNNPTPLKSADFDQ